jgi:hypothetical protein
MLKQVYVKRKRKEKMKKKKEKRRKSHPITVAHGFSPLPSDQFAIIGREVAFSPSQLTNPPVSKRQCQRYSHIVTVTRGTLFGS